MRRIIAAACTLWLCVFVAAQDGHYWTQQYGTSSMLLSGSVIAGVSDLGAVYYNPGRLGQIEKPAFLLSADVYELNRIRVEDAFGNNADASKQDFGGVPSLAAGTFKVPFMPKHHFAWAILVRQNSNISFSFRKETHDDVIPQFPGDEYFGAELSMSQSYKETWTGGNWAYPITDKLSVGVSGYFAQSNIGRGLRINLQALSSDSLTAIYKYNKSYSMSNYSILAKFGLSYKFKYGLFGFTVLCPQLRLKGSGSYQYERLFSGIPEYSENPDYYGTSNQSGMNTAFRSAWAIGSGLTWNIKQSKIHLSSEWYSALPKYTMMTASTHYAQSNGDTLAFKVVDEFKSVINAGLGTEWYLGEKISFYLSASTDFSAVTSDINTFFQNKKETNNSVFKSDFYHYAGGFVLNSKGAEITLGLTHTGANLDFYKPFSFPDGEGGNILDPEEPGTLFWDRTRFVFSFSMPILKDVQRKVEQKLGF